MDATIPDTVGGVPAVFHCERQGGKLKIAREGVSGNWNVLIRRAKSKLMSVDGNEVAVDYSVKQIKRNDI